MPLKTGDEYLKSLRPLQLKAHILGQQDSPDDHGLVKLSRQASDTRKLEDFSMDVGNTMFGGQEV